MNCSWLEKYCESKKGAVKDYKLEWDATRFCIEGKMFVLWGKEKNKKEIVTVKCDPAFGQAIRKEYKDVIPGYYMNKEHWNSVYLNGQVPDKVLKTMIDMSHELILKSLPKKLQAKYKN